MSLPVPGWPVAFRGSTAVAAGLVTWDRLRGPRFQRLLPDVYAPVAAAPVTAAPITAAPPALLLRSLAAYRWANGRAGSEGVLSGYSAACVLGPTALHGAPRPR